MSRNGHRRGAFSCLLVAAALAGFIGATVGLPVVAPPRDHKDRLQPYPCMDHACGCRSAEACWRACCCFTNAQKLVWAADHGVTPPEYVFAAAARETGTAIARGCCHTTAGQCNLPDKTCDHETCDSDHGYRPKTGLPGDTVSHTKWSVEFVLAIEARRCQGQTPVWLALGAIAPPPSKVEPRLEHINCGFVSNAAQSLDGISHSPAEPPPRG